MMMTNVVMKRKVRACLSAGKTGKPLNLVLRSVFTTVSILSTALNPTTGLFITYRHTYTHTPTSPTPPPRPVRSGFSPRPPPPPHIGVHVACTNCYDYMWGGVSDVSG